MAWTRLGDEFCDDSRWEHVPYTARWTYFALVTFASRSERYDGVMPLRAALRTSDTPDVLADLEALQAVGFVFIDDGAGTVTVADAEDLHMPPPSVRDKARKARQRIDTAKSRRAKCDAGEHDRHCPAATCPEKARRSEEEQAGKTLGKILPQDRTGQARTLLKEGSKDLPELPKDQTIGKHAGLDLPEESGQHCPFCRGDHSPVAKCPPASSPPPRKLSSVVQSAAAAEVAEAWL